MIYSNSTLQAVERTVGDYTLNGVCLGERGAGCREIYLPLPPGYASDDLVICGNTINPNLFVGMSKSGKPRLNRGDTNALWLILSSRRGYNRGNGGIFTVAREDGTYPSVIAKGYGSDDAVRRNGTWDHVLIHTQDRDIFRVMWSGGDQDLYVVDGLEVISAGQNDCEELFEELDYEPPFTINDESSRYRFVKEEWKRCY